MQSISCDDFEPYHKMKLLLSNDVLVVFSKTMQDGGLKFHIWNVGTNQKVTIYILLK
jgi:hypothetical protein